MSVRTLLRQTVTLAAPATTDLYGKSTYGTAVSHPARVEPVSELTRDLRGKDVVVIADVYLNGDVTATHAYKLTLHDGTVPVIAAIDKHTDGRGNIRYTRIRCTR